MARPIKFRTLPKKNGLVKGMKQEIENYGVIKSTEPSKSNSIWDGA